MSIIEPITFQKSALQRMVKTVWVGVNCEVNVIFSWAPTWEWEHLASTSWRWGPRNCTVSRLYWNTRTWTVECAVTGSGSPCAHSPSPRSTFPVWPPDFYPRRCPRQVPSGRLAPTVKLHKVFICFDNIMMRRLWSHPKVHLESTPINTCSIPLWRISYWVNVRPQGNASLWLL